MGATLDLNQSRKEREMRELAEKFTTLGEEVFASMFRQNFSVQEADQFIRLILPSMFTERMNKAVYSQKASDVLAEAAQNVANTL